MASTRDNANLCRDDECPVARAVRSLDGKWTLLIIRDLLGGTRRFGELRTSLGGISSKTLTDRLRDLAEAGLVTRTMYSEIPPRVEYALTDRGRAAVPIIDALGAWGSTLPA
jgi:DNA-binding HxlR family transcriptional regulator